MSTRTPTTAITLARLQTNDQEKHRILEDFFLRVKERRVLPDLRDIREFAFRIGLEDIRGKSRKEALPRLIQMLSELPTSKLKKDIERADTISEEHRRQGFSILVAKLLSD